ncbi:putative methionine-R-sulfoxide reductase SelR [Aspergillus insuetus]
MRLLESSLRIITSPLIRFPAAAAARPQLVPHPPAIRKVLRSAPAIPFLSSFFSSSAKSDKQSEMAPPTDNRSEDEWRAVLSPGMPTPTTGVLVVEVEEASANEDVEQFRILRQKGTERPGTGEYDSHYPSEGVYACAGCSAPLYKATHKFKSGCGWPAYFDSIPGAVARHVDSSFGMERTEITCTNCGGHLGHVFKGEGYPTPTDERHCVNSISLKFTEGDGESAKAKA